MRKMILAIFAVLLFLCSVQAEAANKMWWATGRTGGGDALDGIDGADVTAGDGAIVVTDIGATTPGIEFYRAYESGVAESDPNVISPNSNAGTKRWHRIPSASGGDNYLLNSDADGTMGWTSPATFDPAGTGAAAAAASVPLSTIVAAGDVIVGSGVGAVTKITKGANNTLFGVNSAGVLGYYDSHSHVLTAAPAVNDTYSGTPIVLTAGAVEIPQWALVYCKNNGAGVNACYAYDADGADKEYPPLYMATAVVPATTDGIFLAYGTIRNDEWATTNNLQEGYLVCADTTTAGNILFVAPATGCTAPVGVVLEDNKIYFNPSMFGAGTGTGQVVRATSPTLTTPNIGAATGTSLALTGNLSGLMGVITKSGAYTLGTDSANELNGYMVLATAAMTLTLPDMVVGQSFCAMSRDDNEVLTIDAHANDSITLCPTAATCVKGVAGATVLNTVAAADGAGNYICFLVVEADNIMQMGGRGTWSAP